MPGGGSDKLENEADIRLQGKLESPVIERVPGGMKG